MLYLYHGYNTYDSWFTLQDDLGKLAKKPRIIEGDELESIDSIFDCVDNYGLFSENLAHAIVIKRLSKNKHKNIFVDLESKLSNIKSNVELYFWEDTLLDKKTKLFNLIDKLGRLKLFKELNQIAVKKVITDYCKNHDIKISEEFMAKLLMIVSPDKYSLLNELSKLTLLLKSQKRTKLTLADLQIITVNTIESQVWDLTEAVSKKDRLLALTLVNKLVQKSEDFAFVVAALANQLELLYLYKLNDSKDKIIAGFKIHPFVFEKYRTFANKFDISQIQFLMMKLANLDFSIKQGKIDSKLGLNLLMATI